MKAMIKVPFGLAFLLLALAGSSNPAVARGIDVGVNMRNIIHYGDANVLQYAEKWMQEDVLREMQAHNVPIMRVFVANSHVDQVGNYMTTAKRLRDFLNIAEDYGIRVIACLVDAIWTDSVPVGMDTGRYYSRDPDSHLYFLNAYFYEEGWKEEYRTFVSWIVSWNRGHPSLYAWEPANEMLQMRTIDLQTFKNGVRDITNYIRSQDRYTPISTGMIGASHQKDQPSPNDLYSSWPAVDIICVHYYEDTKGGGEPDIAWALENNKTAIVGEFGIPGRDRSERARRYFDAYQRWGAKVVLWWGHIPCHLWDYGDGDRRYGWDCLFEGRDREDYISLGNLFKNFNQDAHLPVPGSLTEGAGPTALGEGKKVSGAGSVTPVGRSRPAKYYWGIEGIDDIETRRFADGRTWTYLIGLHQFDKAEYLMRLGGTRAPKLWLYGIGDNPGPVLMNIYIDGVFRTTASWVQNDNKGHWTNTDVEDIPFDDHAVCVEFANDNDVPGESDRALNLYLNSVYAPAAPWPPR